MFVSYNRQISPKLIESKASLLSETLHTLKTERIPAFFKMVRETEEVLPTDGTLKKILTGHYQEFTNYVDNSNKLGKPRVITKADIEYMRSMGQKYPNFKGILEEIIQCPEDYVTLELHKRFCEMIKDSDNLKSSIRVQPLGVRATKDPLGDIKVPQI